MYRISLICLFLTHPLAFAQSKPPEGTSEKNLEYGKHERNKLDLFVPKGDGPFPLVIYVHGGSWEGGSKDGNAAASIAAKGFAVASINYRLSNHAVFPAQIEDCRAAVRFLRSNAKKYKLNSDRFGAVGLSAGGHLVSLLGTGCDVKELDGKNGKQDVSCAVQAVVDFYGPTDLAKLSPAFAKNNPVTRLLGGTTGDKKELATLGNPITHISKKTPPFLIIHGDKDTLVPVSQSELLSEALKKEKVDSTLVVVPGAGHGRDCHTDETQKQWTAFFEKHLKK